MMGPMRRPPHPLFPALLLLAACSGAPEFEGRPAPEWADRLNGDETGDEAHEALQAGGADAVPVLAAILQKGKPRAQLRAMEIVGRLGPAAGDAVPTLVKLLAHEQWQIRGFAALALGRIGKLDDMALVKLDRALKDKHPRVRLMAALAVWNIAADAVTAKDAVLKEMRSPDPEMRLMIAEFLPEMEHEAVDPLTIMLLDEVPEVRATALDGLARLGPAAERAIPTVEALLLDEGEPLVRTAAVKALVALRGAK